MVGYELAHMARGRWNGVAIASRVASPTWSRTRLGPVGGGDDEDGEPAHEARMIAATCGGVRVVSLYAPNGRALNTPFYDAKLTWFRRLRDWLDADEDPSASLVLGGDLNVAPTDLDVYDPAAYVGTTHISAPSGPFQAPRLGLEDLFPAVPPESGRSTGGTIGPGNSTRAPARIDHLWRPARSSSEPLAPTSIAMRARASCRRITRRSTLT
jgi:exodeoxyribonuclease-3